MIGADVQMLCRPVLMSKYGGAEVLSRNRGAEQVQLQRCRGCAEVQRLCRGTQVHRCTGAKMQKAELRTGQQV